MYLRKTLAIICLSGGLMLGARYLGSFDEAAPSPEARSGSGAVLIGTNGLAALRHGPATVASAPPEAVIQDGSTPFLPSSTQIADAASVEPAAFVPEPVDVTASQWRTVASPAANADTHAMTRDIQAELARMGCYRGAVDGQWTPSVRAAAQEFNMRLNAVLPVDEPDIALLMLARSQATPICVTMVQARQMTPAGADGLALGADAALAPEGRMSLGATDTDPYAVAAPAAPKTSSLGSPRRRIKEVEHLFMHPLGTQ